MTADITALRNIWQQAFGDTEETLDAFFATGFSEERCHYVCREGKPVSALYWFDCTLSGHKLAYLYAVATEENHRGKGLARQLMTETHRILREKGYAGAVLVPGTKELFAMYETLGYRTVSQITEFTAQRGSAPVSLKQIDADRYAQLRKAYLPAGGVVQEGATLDFLQTQTRFYEGTDLLLAASQEGQMLTAQELLGSTNAAPGILCTLSIPQGRFRTPGDDRDFAMLFPLREDCPVPAYFGLAMD